MGIDKTVEKIDDMKGIMLKKVHSLEKELKDTYDIYCREYSPYVKAVKDSDTYAIGPTWPGRGDIIITYASPPKSAVIGEQIRVYDACEPLSPSYIKALKELKEYMTDALYKKAKEFESLDKLFE